MTPDTVTAAVTIISTVSCGLGNSMGGTSAARVHRFRKTGTPADRANRPPVFNIPDNRDAAVMQAR